MTQKRYVEFCGELKWETDQAYLVFDGSHEIWLPKSKTKARQLRACFNEWEFIVPAWLAREKGII